MALVKKNISTKIQKQRFEDSDCATVVALDPTQSEDTRIQAVEFLIDNSSMSVVLNFLISLTSEDNNIANHIYIDLVFSNFVHHKKDEEDFNAMFKMLKSQNVYLRNMVIKYLQENGSDARFFIKKLMQNSDKDLRIFAINILGDVRFEESVEMLRYFIAQEGDVNAMMTAVDYLGEIGSEVDIELLEAVKKEHSHDSYVAFGADLAIERLKGCR